jgi:hypothetical protein
VNSSRRRAFAALFALVAVLFSQLAVSAYACPGAASMVRAAVSPQEAPQDAPPPCHEQPADAAPTPLCQAHCQQGDQSSDVRAASLPVVAFVVLPSWAAPVFPLHDARPIEAQPSLLERPTGPPLAVRHCCFRI